VIDDLDRIGIFNKADVIVTETRRFEFAYPVYDHGYTERTRILRDYFKSIDVELLGRFAEFDYINSDECLHRALLMADKFNAL
jgi:protoporphyrinogen oxidase